ncbi:ribosomal-protein-L7p-serine acetyltransferase [Secundilactobacillus oryzae JCM 18671]|uniref:Ribosomal-protein-L7p-serine acetyltransferase n=1 Tax=Secundilactobacillus oryzae JCM 18671 TaxID=1291743 RepID=A0A081BHT5_9LACO|nr:ribosomal-protein-L7p-serine acetyltransferase [Secundilactobacillus oryzae JCM 18671]
MQEEREELDFLRECNLNAGEGKSLNLVIRFNGRSVGINSFNEFGPLDHSSEIGYWLNTADTGKGIVSQALQGLMTVGFQELGLNKLIIRAAVANDPSNSVAKRAGFHLDGVEREGIRLDDGFVDVNQWSMLRSEWQQ